MSVPIPPPVAGLRLACALACLLGAASAWGAAEPPPAVVTQDQALAALEDIASGKRVKDHELYAGALKAFDQALRQPNSPMAKRPAFIALVGKVRSLPQAAFGTRDHRLEHFKKDQQAALRIMWDLRAGIADLRADPAPKHPAADFYPGALPADAERVTQTVEINAKSVGWVSTGLYAPAGEKVTLTIPKAWIGQPWRVRIGANTSELSLAGESSKTLDRFPKISGEMALTEAVTVFGNAFGGPIYLCLPDNGQNIQLRNGDVEGTPPPPAPEPVQVTLAGAVRMPMFKLGQTSIVEWLEAQSRNPAPICEWATDKIIFTMPSSFVRAVEDPAIPLAVWDQVQDANAELSGRSQRRPVPMRLAIDAAVKWGEAYAEYPICAPFYWTPPIVAGKPGWGHVHEIGHLHQKKDWTFQGGTEVTVNLFSMYALETVMHDVTRRKAGYTAEKIDQWLAKTPDERNWMKGGDLAMKLALYGQLIEGFGWQPVKDVLKGYRVKPCDPEHQSDPERAGEFMVRYSKRVGKNLAPFFSLWGVQLAPGYEDMVKELPVWQPAGVVAWLKAHPGK